MPSEIGRLIGRLVNSRLTFDDDGAPPAVVARATAAAFGAITANAIRGIHGGGGVYSFSSLAASGNVIVQVTIGGVANVLASSLIGASAVLRVPAGTTISRPTSLIISSSKTKLFGVSTVAAVAGFDAAEGVRVVGSGSVAASAAVTASGDITLPGNTVMTQEGEILYFQEGEPVQFQSAAAATTPLSQPYWLDWTEDYTHTKTGLEYDSVTYETLFTENNVITVTTDAELNSAIATAKSNSSIDAIYLRPKAADAAYVWTKNSLFGVTRPIDRPLVIRTEPGSASQAKIDYLNEEKYIANCALVDLWCPYFRFIGGGDNMLLEKCTGRMALDGLRVGGLPSTPQTNLQIRLNYLCDNYALSASVHMWGYFSYNYDGLLFEGNFLDHNGWLDDPLGRALPASSGGPKLLSHNVYFSRPGNGLVARYNWCSRGSNLGFHCKAGGRVYGNIFVRNPENCQIGYGDDNLYNLYGLCVDSYCGHNAFLDSDDISYVDNYPRGYAMWTTCVQNAMFENNVAIDNTTSPVNDAYLYVERQYPVSATFQNNKSKNWNGDIFLNPDPIPASITQSGNQFNTTITPTGQALADYLKSDAYIYATKPTRKRVGADILQLKADISTLYNSVGS